jgi:hypothetical protein
MNDFLSTVTGGLLAILGGGVVAVYTQRMTGYRSKADRIEQRRIEQSSAATAMIIQSIPWRRASVLLFEHLASPMPDSEERNEELQKITDRYNIAEKNFREAAITARLSITSTGVKREVNTLYDIYRSFGEKLLGVLAASGDERWRLSHEALEAVEQAKQATNALERHAYDRYVPKED